MPRPAARVQRPSMRFVPVKSAARQATCMLHRVRDQLVGQRTATINARRGHLTELGMVAAQRQAGLRQLLATLGDLEEERIPPLARKILQTLAAHLRDLEDKIAALDRRLLALTRNDPICRAVRSARRRSGDRDRGRGHRARCHELPFGPSSCGLARPGAGAARHRRQRTPARLEQSDAYLRRQLIHGARALVKVSPGRTGKLWAWSTACGRAGRSTSWSRRWPTSWRASSGRYSAVASPTGSHEAPGSETATSCAGDVDVRADRSDRGRHNHRWSTSLALVRMIGCRSADLIEASGRRPHPKDRRDGSSRDRHARCFEKALAKREASMDGPSNTETIAAHR
jgi:hypothetical protein